MIKVTCYFPSYPQNRGNPRFLARESTHRRQKLGTKGQSQLESTGTGGVFLPESHRKRNSLEVLGLNLEGTELVTLSACKTGHGVQDYSEGVMGLVRAFRIAGAQRVLMTLKSVDDNQAKDFMIAFYQNWLNKPNIDPADALRQTKLDFLQHKKPEYRDPKVWSPYILVE